MIGRSARLVWGGITLLLLALLIGSFFLSRGAIADAEQEAERRAETLAASVLFDELTPETVQGDILGPEYRDLIIAVQAGILSDDRVAQVRLWTPEGDLIFSTAQRDKITEFVAEDNPQIERAADGQTNSLITSTTVAPRAGLEGSDEQLFETFVPLRLANEISVSGVVQIDQLYEEIRAEGLRVWRPVQIAVAFLIPAAVVLLVLSIRKRDEEGPAAVPVGAAAAAAVPVDDRELRDAQERAQAAERAAREAEDRMAEMDKRLREADKAGTTPSMLSRVEELDLKLRASEAEREQYVGEIQRLRTQLGERDAEVAALHQGASAADADRAEKVIAEAERLIGEAEAKATAAEERAADLEGKLKLAETAAATAMVSKAKEGAVDDLRAELESVSAERDTLTARVTELEALTAERDTLAARVTELEAVTAERAPLTAELADADAFGAERDELSAKVAELETTLAAARATILGKDKELEAKATRDAEAAAADAAAVEERIQAAELRAADAQERLVDLQARLDESESTRTALEARLPELEAAVAAMAELDARATRAEQSLADSAGKLEAAETSLAEATAKLTAAEEARAANETALVEARTAAEQAEAARATLAAEAEKGKAAAAKGKEGPSPTDLQARVEELEAARRTDITELQRAQESLANTQVELANATRKLKEAEGRLRELESEGAAAPAPELERVPAPVPDYVSREPEYVREAASAREPEPEPASEAPAEISSFAARLSSLRQEIAAATRPAEPEEPAPAPEEAPAEEEGLSLRERLARAAAARHRGPLT